MKIIIVGPGIMEIPPKGWGAVEILIWDQYSALKKIGHSVFIVNTKFKMSSRSKSIFEKRNFPAKMDDDQTMMPGSEKHSPGLIMHQ